MILFFSVHPRRSRDTCIDMLAQERESLRPFFLSPLSILEKIIELKGREQIN